MFCPRCGDESPDEVRYCSSCGAELPKRSESGPGPDSAPQTSEAGWKGRALSRIARLVGRSRKERVVSGLTAALLVVGVIAFLALDPAEDEEAAADREALDAACVAAKAQVVEAANALTEPGGAPQYATRIVIAMTDLRDAAAVSGITGVEALRRAAFEAAVAAGRVGRVSRETTSPEAAQEALRQSVDALDALSGPTEELALTRCSTTQIRQGGG